MVAAAKSLFEARNLGYNSVRQLRLVQCLGRCLRVASCLVCEELSSSCHLGRVMYSWQRWISRHSLFCRHSIRGSIPCDKLRLDLFSAPFELLLVRCTRRLAPPCQLFKRKPSIVSELPLSIYFLCCDVQLAAVVLAALPSQQWGPGSPSGGAGPFLLCSVRCPST